MEKTFPRILAISLSLYPVISAPFTKILPPFILALLGKTLVEWEAQIPSVNTGAFSAEAQSALLAVTPNILNGSDLDTELAAAEEQFNQTIQ